MPVKFYSPAADSNEYPDPLVSMLPSASFQNIINCKSIDAMSAFSRNIYVFKQARYALAYALRLLGSHGSVVLMPSYHCRSLVEPAIYCGVDVLFYSMTAELEPDLGQLLKLIDTISDYQTKVLVVPHYFGFPQAIHDILKICDDNNIVLIEDCAHAYYGSYAGKLLGTFGRFAIASPRKFFPIEDGGLLIDNQREFSGNDFLEPPSFTNELKSVARYVSQHFITNFKRMKSRVSPEIDFEKITADTYTPKETEFEFGMKWFDVSKSDVAGSVVSQWLIRHLNHGDIISKRRINYLHWFNGVNDIEGCHPVFPEIVDGVVPYVFSLVIDSNPEKVFHALKISGVPIWRWEDMAVTDCKISENYRLSLFQLPCHQGLSYQQITWMLGVIRNVLFEYNRD